MRPSQWSKNLFVFAPALFAQRFTDAASAVHIGLAFAAFCMAASAVYLLNDTLDREADRRHPTKRHRPIASGALSPGLAVVASCLLGGGAIAWSVAAGLPSLATVLACYLAIQVLYSWRLKHLVVLDVLCIASGFVLRLLAGGFAGDIHQSKWILVCTIFLSLLLALCKRRSEVAELGEEAPEHRAILAQYPLALLDQFISAATAATLLSYTLYTVDPATVALHGLGGSPLPPLLVTVPFVIYGVFRYLYLVFRRGGGGSPTVTLGRDVPSVLNALLYGVAVVLVLQLAA